MGVKNKFSSKPKVMTFDDVLKSAQPFESKRSGRARHASQQSDLVDTAHNTNIEDHDDVQEMPVYKGISLYRFKNNIESEKTKNALSHPTTAIYGGKSSEYDVWREGDTTYVRHKVGRLFEDVLVGNENIRFVDKLLKYNDPNIGTKPPMGRVKRVSQEHIKKITSQKEFFNFNQKKNIEYNYVYNDITKKLECQKNTEILDEKQENAIQNLTATGDIKSLSAKYIEAGNILDYIQWKK